MEVDKRINRVQNFLADKLDNFPNRLNVNVKRGENVNNFSVVVVRLYFKHISDLNSIGIVLVKLKRFEIENKLFKLDKNFVDLVCVVGFEENFNVKKIFLKKQKI